MNLANKTFRNNRTGETIKVIDAFEDIAILENKQKVKVTQLMDTNQYTEQIDPDSFFNSQGAYNSLADRIKNIPTNNIVDSDGGVTVNFGDDSFKPAMNESAIIMSNEDDEKSALMAKYGAIPEATNEAAKQAEAFNRILNPEETPIETYKPPIQTTNIPGNINTATTPQPPVQRVEVEDPIITMFKRTKRNVNFNVNFEISDKIPRLDFIEMLEDSYEVSIIEFLADELTKKLLEDPNSIKVKIMNEINEKVYPKPVNKSTAGSKGAMTTTIKKTTTKSSNTKLEEVKVEPPKPPKDRIIVEGETPEKPKSMK
jgi:hypothetical protein